MSQDIPSSFITLIQASILGLTEKTLRKVIFYVFMRRLLFSCSNIKSYEIMTRFVIPDSKGQ